MSISVSLSNRRPYRSPAFPHHMTDARLCRDAASLDCTTSRRSEGEAEVTGLQQTLTLVRMLLARSAYASVFRDSSKAMEAGLMWAIMTVRLFPPRESYQSKNQYGFTTWYTWLLHP